MIAYRPSRGDAANSSGSGGSNTAQQSRTAVNSTVQRTFDLLLHVDDSHIGIYTCFILLYPSYTVQEVQLELCSR